MSRTPFALEVRLRGSVAWCEGPVQVALQSGRDERVCVTDEAAIDGARLRGGVEAVTGKDGELDFRGALVHGRRGERFIYLAWSVEREGEVLRFRRLKLHLSPLTRAAWSQPGLTWEQVRTGQVVVEVDAAGADGTPACGTSPALWRAGDYSM